MTRMESFEYETIARNLVSGHGYTIPWHGTIAHTMGSPVYPFICAAVYSLGGGERAMMGLQLLFSIITGLAIYSIGTQLFSKRVGVIAGVLAALHPAILYYDIFKLHPLSLDAMLAALSVALVLRLYEKPSPWLIALAGFVHGISLLERTTQVLAVVFAIGVLLRSRLLPLYLVCLLILPTVWTVRNYQIYHRFVWVSATAPILLWWSNNKKASGGPFVEGKPGVSVFGTSVELEQKTYGKPELEQTAIYSHAAWDYIRADWPRAIRAYVKRFVTFWWFSPASGYYYPPQYLTIYKILYGVGLYFVWIGLLQCIVWPSPERWLSIGFIASVAVLQAIYYVEVRHRWGIEPLMMVFAVGGIMQ